MRLLLPVLLALAGGCVHSESLRLAAAPRTPGPKALVFFVDGVNGDVFDDMLARGELPNLQRYLYDRGCRARRAVTCIPSITYAVTASFTTGRFPGHHQILGNKWFDRTSGRYQNYHHIWSYQQIDQDLPVPTIYEMLYDRFTVSIQSANRRGVTRPIDNWTQGGLRWFFKQRMVVDQLVAIRFELISECAVRMGRWPDFILAYFPGCDEIGHRQGSTSPAYRAALANADAQIGRICRGLQDAGVFDDYTLFFVSDHGHVPVVDRQYWGPEDFLEKELGLRVANHVFLETGELCRRQQYLNRSADVVVINGGNRRAHVFLRAGQYWDEMPTYDQIQGFLNQPGLRVRPAYAGRSLADVLADQAAVRVAAVRMGPDRVEVLGRGRRAVVEREPGRKNYRYLPQAGDPLGYDAEPAMQPMLDGGFHASRDWLAASVDTEFPDFVPQIVEMFDSPRAGEITLFADTGWEFNPRNLSGHGSAVRGDMIVPFVMAGRGIPKGEIPVARAVDLVPTILSVLGLSDRIGAYGPLDGISLVPAMQSMAATRPSVGAAQEATLPEGPKAAASPGPARTRPAPATTSAPAR